MRRTPVLIIGGGPAGSAAAITLARGGVQPDLVERTAGPHDMVCGGFLGWDALAALRRLGIDAGALGARPIHRVRLVAGTRIAEADLPYPAAGLSRRLLDDRLLAAAAAAGVRITRGRTVRSFDEASSTARLDDGSKVGADAMFLATGKHELRGAPRPVGKRSLSAGLRVALPKDAARDRELGGVIELHLFDEGYSGLLLQEDGTTNLCLSVSPRRLNAAGGVEGFVSELLVEAPILAERIGGDLPGGWRAIAGVPYGWRAQETSPGLFRVGDQAAVIASLAGDGIAIAVTSGISAAEALLAGGAPAAPAWQQDFRRRSSRPIGAAQLLRYGVERKLPRRGLMQMLALAPGLGSLAARLTRIG
jgi:flavin-dependent dehydrogenase